ncbi:uncharacterized protein LOC143174758 isoform X2 [Nomia melanderi]
MMKIFNLIEQPTNIDQFIRTGPAKVVHHQRGGNMGTASIDLRAVDRSERRALLGRSSHAAGPSHEDAEPGEPTATGRSEGGLRGATQPAAAANRSDNGGRLPPEDNENATEEMTFYPRNKRNGKRNTRNRKRKVTFAL